MKVSDKEAGLSKAQSETKAAALAAEKVVNEARIEAAKPVVEEVVVEEVVVEEVVVEEVVAEAEVAPETIDQAAEKAAE